VIDVNADVACSTKIAVAKSAKATIKFSTQRTALPATPVSGFVSSRGEYKYGSPACGTASKICNRIVETTTRPNIAKIDNSDEVLKFFKK